MNNKIKRALPQLQTRAELGNLDETSRTVEVTWSTGAKGLRSGFFTDPYYEELDMSPNAVDMSRLQSGTAPVLASHDQWSLDSVIGVVDRAWLENGQGKALLRFSTDPAADSVFKKVKDRILRNVSVGYAVQEYTDVSEPKDEVQTLRATHWQPREISIVPIGFDAKATTRSEQVQTNEVEIIVRSSSTKTETTTMNEKELAEAKAKADAEAALKRAADEAKVRAEADAQLRAEAAQAERTRIAEITRAVKAAKLDEALIVEFTASGISSADAAKEVFKRLEAAQNTSMKSAALPSAEVTRDEKDTKREALINAWANRTSDKVQLTEQGRIYRGMSMSRALEDYIGRKVGEVDHQLVTRAMTTSDLPNILANIAEKSMRSEYLIQPQSFKPWTRSGTLRNYKQHNDLLLGDYPSLEEVDEHGEAHQGAPSESMNPRQIKRYLKAVQFTKEMIINDDLNALSNFSIKGANAAARLESTLVYTSTLMANPTMQDGNALFSSAHGNYVQSGSGAAPSVTTVGTAMAAMKNQKSINGVDYLDLIPKFLIVGTALEVVARQLVSTQLLATQLSNINPFAGQLNVVVDPRVTGTQWFLAADPAQIDTITLSKLEGEDGPIVTVEKGRLPGSILITTEHNVGASAIDYRGLYMNYGS